MAEYYRALRHLHIVLALLTVAFLFSVARAHHPLGAVAAALR
jgi:hypothetical protein